jgi:hypothetical protein
VKRRFKLLKLATKYADVHAGSHCYYTSPAQMWLLYAMNCNNSASIGTCHGTIERKLFGTFGIEQFKVTSCTVLLLRTPKKMLCTYRIQILSCAKVLEDGRRRGLGTTWMKQKLDLQ